MAYQLPYHVLKGVGGTLRSAKVASGTARNLPWEASWKQPKNPPRGITVRNVVAAIGIGALALTGALAFQTRRSPSEVEVLHW